MPWVRDYAATLKCQPIYGNSIDATDSGKPVAPPGVPPVSRLAEQVTGLVAGKWGSAREPQSLAEHIRQKTPFEGPQIDASQPNPASAIGSATQEPGETGEQQADMRLDMEETVNLKQARSLEEADLSPSPRSFCNPCT